MGFSILGCPHNHLSFPIVTSEVTVEAGNATAPEAKQPHVTCLDCGREFWYDWTRMRRLAERPQPVYSPRRVA